MEEKYLKNDFATLCHIHKLTCDKLVIENNLGVLRSTPVSIDGTSWKPQLLIGSQIKEELEQILTEDFQKTNTEIAIEVMLWVMRRQMFIDGNKRVAMLFANKIMIDN